MALSTLATDVLSSIGLLGAQAQAGLPLEATTPSGSAGGFGGRGGAAPIILVNQAAPVSVMSHGLPGFFNPVTGQTTPLATGEIPASVPAFPAFASAFTGSGGAAARPSTAARLAQNLGHVPSRAFGGPSAAELLALLQSPTLQFPSVSPDLLALSFPGAVADLGRPGFDPSLFTAPPPATTAASTTPGVSTATIPGRPPSLFQQFLTLEGLGALGERLGVDALGVARPSNLLAQGVDAVATTETVQNVLNALGIGRAGGATLTPSGQLTTAAPEVLRDLQFAGEAATAGTGAAVETGAAGVGAGLESAATHAYLTAYQSAIDAGATAAQAAAAGEAAAAGVPAGTLLSAAAPFVPGLLAVTGLGPMDPFGTTASQRLATGAAVLAPAFGPFAPAAIVGGFLAGKLFGGGDEEGLLGFGKSSTLGERKIKEAKLQRHLAAGAIDAMNRVVQGGFQIPDIVGYLNSSDNLSHQGFAASPESGAVFNQMISTLLDTDPATYGPWLLTKFGPEIVQGHETAIGRYEDPNTGALKIWVPEVQAWVTVPDRQPSAVFQWTKTNDDQTPWALTPTVDLRDPSAVAAAAATLPGAAELLAAYTVSPGRPSFADLARQHADKDAAQIQQLLEATPEHALVPRGHWQWTNDDSNPWVWVSEAQAGGVVPGRGRGDRVPMRLEPGEVVVPRDLAQQVLARFPELRKPAGGDPRFPLQGTRVPVPHLSDAMPIARQLEPYFRMREAHGIEPAPLELRTPREEDTARERDRIQPGVDAVQGAVGTLARDILRDLHLVPA